MCVKLLFRIIVGLFFLFPTLCCNAGVTVTENVSPGATSWPGSPLISVAANRVSQTSVGESSNAVVRGPVTLTNLLSVCARGDYLRLSVAGHHAMAEAIDLNLFTQ